MTLSENMINLLFIISLIVYLLFSLLELRKDLHIIQLNSYMTGRYFKWVRYNILNKIRIKRLLPILAFIPLYLNLFYLFLLCWISSYLFLLSTIEKVHEKKRLVFTNRAIRLYTTSALLSIAILFVIYSKFRVSNELILPFIFLVLLNIFSPIGMLISNIIVSPLEKMINHWYFNDAKKKVKQFNNLTVIGITGSFGKTSTKYILNKILSDRYNTLMTPESYNTPMGITKVIRTQLKPIHEIFIAEMGAKKKGDIKELCNLVSPKIGILTAIGEQHLETFGSINNIISTKNELIESLPDEGIAFLNRDNNYIKELPQRKNIKYIYYGIDSENLNFYARNIQYTPIGTDFMVCDDKGNQFKFKSKLLGKHNVYNILAAASVANELGMDLLSISHAIKSLEPVPHRLELKTYCPNVILIDDAYNSNPIGFNIALDVLKEMNGERKILVTPGMIELGDKHYDINKAVGVRASQFCDYIILIGTRQTKPIQDGLKIENYSKDKIYITNTFTDANRYLQDIVEDGDVILFENDLPDNYSE